MIKPEKIAKVTKALKAYSRVKIAQAHVVNRITNWAAVGRNEVEFHTISTASAIKLKKVGFKVTIGPNKPPKMIKYIINWQHF